MRQADLRLLPAVVLAWVVAFLVPGLAPSATLVPAVGLGLVALAVLALVWRRRRRGRRSSVLVAVAAALVVAGAVGAIGAAGLERATGGRVDELAAARAIAEVELRTTGDPRRARTQAGVPGPPTWLVDAVVTEVTARGSTSTASAPVLVVTTDEAWTGLLPSTRVRVLGRLGPVERVQREVAVLRVDASPTVVGEATAVQRVAGAVRAGLRRAVDGLSPDPRGLVPGLVVGDETLLPADLEAASQTSGLTHLTAVSGTNVSIVLVVALAGARWVGARSYAVPLAGALAVVGFVVLARPEPSVLRAAVMGGAVVAAMVAGRGRRLVAPVLVATLVLLLVDPWLARSYGFALSVLASTAIVVLVPGWVERWSARVPPAVATAVAVPLAASLVCAPVVVLISDQVSVVSVLANLLAAPAVPAATVLGVVVAALGVPAPGVAEVLAHAAGVPAAWIAWVARWSADLPYAAVPWPGTAAGALLLAGATLTGAWLVRRLARVPGLLPAIAVVALVTVGVQHVAPGWPPPGWQLAVCDVGQGDALVLDAGAGSAVVVDTGPEPVAVDDCLDDLGVRSVALVLLTHAHADHTGGLDGVDDGRPVGAVATGRPSVDALGRGPVLGLPPSGLVAGDVLVAGSVTLRVLWPPAATVGGRLDPAESAENNASVVVLAETASGLRLLLTGDVEPSAQRALLRSVAAADLRADVLKVPHHGSRHQEPALLTGVGASVAVVSSGLGNTYGHPAPVTLDVLTSTGGRVLRTDEVGDVVVGGGPGRVWVLARGG